jgi:hypothetical protein
MFLLYFLMIMNVTKTVLCSLDEMVCKKIVDHGDQSGSVRSMRRFLRGVPNNVHSVRSRCQIIHSQSSSSNMDHQSSLQ